MSSGAIALQKTPVTKRQQRPKVALSPPLFPIGSSRASGQILNDHTVDNPPARVIQEVAVANLDVRFLARETVRQQFVGLPHISGPPEAKQGPGPAQIIKKRAQAIVRNKGLQSAASETSPPAATTAHCSASQQKEVTFVALSPPKEADQPLEELKPSDQSGLGNESTDSNNGFVHPSSFLKELEDNATSAIISEPKTGPESEELELEF